MFDAARKAKLALKYYCAMRSKHKGFVCSKCAAIVFYVDDFICPVCGKKAVFHVNANINFGDIKLNNRMDK